MFRSDDLAILTGNLWLIQVLLERRLQDFPAGQRLYVGDLRRRLTRISLVKFFRAAALLDDATETLGSEYSLECDGLTFVTEDCRIIDNRLSHEAAFGI